MHTSPMHKARGSWCLAPRTNMAFARDSSDGCNLQYASVASLRDIHRRRAQGTGAREGADEALGVRLPGLRPNSQAHLVGHTRTNRLRFRFYRADMGLVMAREECRLV